MMNGKLIGNAVVGQSGGPTTAINATLVGVIRGAMQHDDVISVLYGMQNGMEGFLEERLINLTETVGDEDSLDALMHTPAAALGSCRKKLPKPEEDEAFYQRLFALFRKYDIRYFFYIGGNDSMDTVSKISAYAERAAYDIRVMGVPKTIDNDLMGTDHTPGFGSAAKFVATTVSEIVRDCAVYTVKAVTIVEIMGRDAGWLTSAAALASLNGEGPDLVYLPERAFSVEDFLKDVRAALERHPGVVVAVSEGVRDKDGEYVGASTQSGATDAFGHRYLEGVGKALERIVKQEIGCKVRSVELSLPQRCAAHIASACDLEESVAVGRAAVDYATSGVSGHMMSLQRVGNDPYRVEICSSDIHAIANKIRQVPADYINEAGNGITDVGIGYLLPLIRGEAFPRFENGLPVQFRFGKE